MKDHCTFENTFLLLMISKSEEVLLSWRHVDWNIKLIYRIMNVFESSHHSKINFLTISSTFYLSLFLFTDFLHSLVKTNLKKYIHSWFRWTLNDFFDHFDKWFLRASFLFYRGLIKNWNFLQILLSYNLSYQLRNYFNSKNSTLSTSIIKKLGLPEIGYTLGYPTYSSLFLHLGYPRFGLDTT